MEDDAIDLGEAETLRTSDKAIQVRLEDEDSPAYASSENGKLWIPRSVIHDDSEVYDDDHQGSLYVQRWWAEKQGWLEE